MANIKVEDLIGISISGLDLFDDSESFIQELSEHELNLQGGLVNPLSPIIITFVPD